MIRCLFFMLFVMTTDSVLIDPNITLLNQKKDFILALVEKLGLGRSEGSKIKDILSMGDVTMPSIQQLIEKVYAVAQQGINQIDKQKQHDIFVKSQEKIKQLHQAEKSSDDADQLLNNL